MNWKRWGRLVRGLGRGSGRGKGGFDAGERCSAIRTAYRFNKVRGYWIVYGGNGCTVYMVVIKVVRSLLRIFKWWILTEECSVVPNVSNCPETIRRSKDFFPSTQLYFPSIRKRCNKIGVSPCCNWSPPSTHTALQLVHSASASYWAFCIYTLRIFMIHVVFTALGPSPDFHSFCLPLFCQQVTRRSDMAKKQDAPAERAKRARWPKSGRRKDCRSQEGWMPRAVKKACTIGMLRE